MAMLRGLAAASSEAALLQQRVGGRQPAAERDVKLGRIARAAGESTFSQTLRAIAGSKMSPVSSNAAKASASSTSDHM